MSNNNNNTPQPNQPSHPNQDPRQTPKNPSLDSKLLDLCAKDRKTESLAKTQRRMEDIKKLLQRGADPNYRGKWFNETPLHMACYGHNPELVRLLINFGADVNSENIQGRAPIHFACSYGTAEVLRIFIENGCDVNHTDKDKKTPLMLSCKRGDPALVKALLEKKECELGKVDNYHDNALTYACAEGEKEVIKFLIERGCDIENKNLSGCTPIFEVCLNGHTEILETLIEKGANLDGEDVAGNTLMKYAFGGTSESKNEFHSNAECIEVLVRHGVPIPEYLSSEKVFSFIREKLMKEMKEEWKRTVGSLLLSTRKFCSESFLSEENLPLDLFKVIFFESIPTEGFTRESTVPLKKRKVECE